MFLKDIQPGWLSLLFNWRRGKHGQEVFRKRSARYFAGEQGEFQAGEKPDAGLYFFNLCDVLLAEEVWI